MDKYPGLDVLFKKGEHGASYFENQVKDHMSKEMDEKKEEEVSPVSKAAYDFKDYQDKDLKLVDTTGAGDSFTGAYSVAILEGKSVEQALDFAC